MNIELENDINLENKNMMTSGNSNLSFNDNFSKSANMYINPYGQNMTENYSLEKNFYLSENDFKNKPNDGLNQITQSIEIPISQPILNQDILKMSDKQIEVTNKNDISNTNSKYNFDNNEDKSINKYSYEIDQLIKETLEKAGLPYTSFNKNNTSENVNSNKLYNSSKPLYDSNSAIINIPEPAYKNFSNSKPENPSPILYNSIKEKEKIITSNYESLNQIEPSLNNSEYQNYVNAVVTNDISTNNNLYNEQITFKDNLSNNETINLFNTNNIKDNLYNTNITNQNYSFENLKTIENNQEKKINPPENDIKREEILVENLSSSTNEQFNISENLIIKSENTNNTVSNNQIINPIAISNLKKNEDLTFASNKNIKDQDSARDSTRAKNKAKEIPEKKDDYLNTQNSITNFPKEYLSDEDFNNLQFELGNTYTKELCGNQINILTKYINIGKVLTSMLPGILNNINPTNRMDAFKILVANIHDWPNDETYFNGIICFLPTANQKEAGDIIKRMNRNNCCCTIF